MGRPDYAAKEHRLQFGKRVLELRSERKWTQERLAEEASMDRSYLANLEAGARNPTLDVIQRLAEALEVSLADLFT